MEAFAELSTIDEIDTEQLAGSFEALSQTFADTPTRSRVADRAWPGCRTPSPPATPSCAQLLATRPQVTEVLADRNEEFRS